jgi:oligopeptidase B
MTLTPPCAAERPQILTHHGRSRIDPYYWLRAENWQAVMQDPTRLDAEIRAYLDAENAYADAALAGLSGLRAALLAEMRGRMKEDEASAPEPDGPYLYYWRFEAGGEHEIHCRRARAETAPEEILLHGDKEADGLAYYRVIAFEQSPDHRLAAYAVDTNGSESYSLRIRDLRSGRDLAEAIEACHGDIAWTADSGGVLYTKLDAHHRPSAVHLHRIAEDPALDRLVYRETDPAFYVALARTQSRRFLTITAHDHRSSEVRILPAAAPDREPLLVEPRTPDHEYSVADHGETLLILTNADGAEDFKIMAAPLLAPGPAHWRPWLPHEEGRLILDFTVYRDHAVRLERVDALPRLVVTALGADTARGQEHAIAFDEEAYSLGIRPGFEFDTQRLRFSYSSPARPLETYDYDLASRTRRRIKLQEVPSGHDPARYTVRRIEAPAADGALIPVTLLHRKDLPLDGSAPLLLYGYGAYGITIPPGFSTNRLSLVDRGFVYAIAHIRGGMDKGYRWYRDGKLMQKRHTFTDFIDAARHLIASGYTRQGRIVAHGGSAGGLLMGAVANMAPELFGGIIAEVPFVDTLTTILDPTLPLTPPEWTEWGNPIEDEAVYDYMASYSPYDNVEAKAYPHIFALGGLTDPRVTYWEPAKWIAKLRKLKTDGNLALLRLNMDAGHAGAAGRFHRLEEVALTYAFALKIAGLASA